ncbi:RdRP-domain-containing protein, partial [Aaosphaeria arxii CBS 175.79]
EQIKIKVQGIPQGYWTEDVYNALIRYGDISRIEMDGPTTAFVLFQYPPPDFSRRITSKSLSIGHKTVRVEIKPHNVRMVPSPVHPEKAHRELIRLQSKMIDFGPRIGESSMMVMERITTHGQVSVTLDLYRKEIQIKFPLRTQDDIRWHFFKMPFAQLEKIHTHKSMNSSDATFSLIIPFDKPPQFYRQATEAELPRTFSKERFWNVWSSWYRQTDAVPDQVKAQIMKEPLRHYSDFAIIDLGKWTTYRIPLPSAVLQSSVWSNFCGALADYGIPVIEVPGYTFQQRSPAQIWGLLPDEAATRAPERIATSASAFDELSSINHNLKFEVRYQLEVCLTHGYLKENNVTTQFMEQLVSMKPRDATLLLEKIADRQIIHYNPSDIFKIPIRASMARKVPSYCVLARSVTITPTTMHVNTPAVETSNRVLRKHAADADRFIRVKFTDEKTEGRLFGKHDGTFDALFERVTRAMEHGIIVAGRHYEFLAYGNSQFRENGAYFYAPTPSASAASIRKSMGYFDEIKSVAKYGARQGQCFSTTRYIHTIQGINVVEIDDVERNGYTFTDGVGKLSPFVAKMAAQELGIPKAFEDPPSLYQFRLAGCKGVLAIDPEISGSAIHIRPSQYKFKAENKGFEVIRTSAFATACFNRQLIVILSTLGVPNHAFIRKQQSMMDDLQKATTDKAVAIDRLQRNIDFNQTTLTIAAMILDGFMKDPFVMSLLHLWRAYNIKFLKEKARIVVDEGAFVLGCVDETATLKGHFNADQCRPDATRSEKMDTLPEIFLQISDPTRPHQYKIVQGECILARNPSLHPGDVRIVRAVDKPALHHLRDVVVLPQTGDRDIAGMCSGGDLDGDDYIVMWDPKFLPTTINEEPMDFTPERPLDKDTPVTTRDLTDFFVTYMKNDSLARIATSHLAQADYNAEGVRDEKCIQLAKLHSQAVDYPKSGIPAIMNLELRPKRWPHFMDNGRSARPYYHSRNILGILYDQVTLVDFKPQYDNPFDERILKAFPSLDEKILREAREVKTEYDFSLRKLMAKHDIQTEFEAWSVFVLSHNQEARDYTFAEEFGRSVSTLKNEYRELCREKAGSKDAVTGQSNMARFVAAMYTVTAREMEEARKEGDESGMVGGRQESKDPSHMPLMSFPWLFPGHLGKIASGRDNDHSVPAIHVAPTKTKARRDIDDTLSETSATVETKEGIVKMGDDLKL